MGYKFNPFTSNLDNVVNVHNKLGGLQGGTTDEYYHLTATEAGYIDQDVTSGSKPNFDGENFTGIPDGALDTDYVEVAGDTMTGLLTLSGAPTNDLHAATKKYVDDSAFLQLAGGTMSGNIVMGDGGTIGQSAGPLLTFDDTNNYLEITGGNVGIGTTSPSTGYKLDVAGFINTNQTVNQYTYPSINALQTAETLQDGSAYTGTESTMSTTYQAVQFTASAAHTMGDFTVRVKESTDITNTTSYIRGYIYADDGGSPGKPTGSPLATGNFIRYGTLTTSYQTLSLGTRYILTNGVKYWLVIEQSAAPTGGNIVLDSDVSSNMGATSTDGSTWTNTNARLRYAIRGRTYYSLYANSTNSYGVYGSSTNSVGIRGSSTSSYGIRGNSTNSYGVYGNSTNSYGVYGSSTNSYGVYGSSTNSVGIRGSSTNSVGVYGSSTSNYGIRGSSTTNRSGYFYRNNTSGTATTAVLDVVQDSATSETNTVLRVQGDGTGDLVNIFDAGTEVFTILDGGNVGIGTAEPNQKLTVAGHITPSSNNTYDIGTSSYKWDDIYATNGTIQTSDANTKDNVEDSDLGLDFIKALKPVKYKWKDYIQTIEEEQPKTDKDGNVIQHDGISETEIVEKQIERTFTRPHYGLIAQDIEQLMVDKGINDFAGFIKSERDDKSVSYGLRYHEFIAPIIKAIQEQQLQIDDLIKRVEKLESIIKKL
jgi:hypothetical protein